MATKAKAYYTQNIGQGTDLENTPCYILKLNVKIETLMPMSRNEKKKGVTTSNTAEFFLILLF